MISSGLLQGSGNFHSCEPGSAPAGQVFPTPKPGINRTFIPPAGHALLMVGRNVEDIDSYFDATVTAPGGIAINTSLQLKSINDLNDLAEKYPKSTLSIGVDLEDSIANIAAGNADEKIDALLDIFAAYDRPVFLRLGYGFDDPANTFAPDAYVSAWKTFYERIQAKGSRNVALVWESISCEESNLVEWYPGDKYVDWMGVSYCDRESVEGTIRFAREHSKPLMVTIAPLIANADWDAWFAPFFQFVNDNNDVIRAATYVNEGDSRIELHAAILKKWRDETRQTLWLRASPDLFDALSK